MKSKTLNEIWTIALRDIKKETALKQTLSILLPFIFILLIGFAFDSFINFDSYKTSYSKFFLSGILPYYIAAIGLNSGIEIVKEKKTFTKLLLTTPISKYSLVLGKILSSLITSIKILIIILALFLFVFENLSLIKILHITIFIGWIILIYYTIGLTLSSFFKNEKTALFVIKATTFALFFASGMFYPLSTLPNYLKTLCLLNPFTYTIDLFRFIVINTETVPLALNILIHIIFGIMMFLFGVYIINKNLRK